MASYERRKNRPKKGDVIQTPSTNFEFENGNTLIAKDIGKVGIIFEIIEQSRGFDETSAVSIPTKKVNEFLKWLQETICQR